jgi:hypothetical protein
VAPGEAEMGKGKIFMGLRRIFSAVSFWLIQEFCEICGFSLKNVIDGQLARPIPNF